MHIERLEDRIAPAAILTFVDVDGDNVTIKTSKGTNAALDDIVTRVDVGGGHFRIDSINLFNEPLLFSMTDLSVTAKAANGGDGFVNVGRIKATLPSGAVWISLGKVAVGGNLGEIDAGSAFSKVSAVKSLSVQTLGPAGFDLANTGGDGRSGLIGNAPSIKIRGDVNGVLSVSGDAGAITIGGNLQGGSMFGTGVLSVAGQLKSATIGGIVGGAGTASGLLSVTAGAGKITILHDVVGGGGEGSGSLQFVRLDSMSGFPLSDNVSSLSIGGNLTSFGMAGQGIASGTIFCTGSIARLSIGGDLVGDNLAMNPSGLSGVFSAQVDVFDVIKSLKVGGNLHAASSVVGGKILAEQFSSRGVTIGSALIGGFGVGGGLSAPSIGSIVVNDDIAGSAAAMARIQVGFSLGSLLVKGSVSSATITAGLDIGGLLAGGSTSPDAQIGPVTVNGSWTASSIAAGIRDVNGDGFGNADDHLVSGLNAALVTATIKSIAIGGTVEGTAAAGDHFGFTAQLIGKMKVHGAAVALTPGAFNDGVGVILAADVTARELAPF